MISLRPIAFFAVLSFLAKDLVHAKLSTAIVITLPSDAPPVDACTETALLDAAYDEVPGDCDARRLRGNQVQRELGFCSLTCQLLCKSFAGVCWIYSSNPDCRGCYNGVRRLASTEENVEKDNGEIKVIGEGEANRDLKSVCEQKDKILDKMKRGVAKAHKKDAATRDAMLAILNTAHVQCISLFEEE